MANQGTIRTRAELWNDALLAGNIPTSLRYFTEVTVGSPTSAVELFINGEQDQRFYLPTNSAVVGLLKISAWPPGASASNETWTAGIGFEGFNINGTVTAVEAGLFGASGNPNVSFAVTANDTIKALTMLFTPALNSTFIVTATLDYTFVSPDFRPSNYYSITA